jgi:hypothetical protein
LKQKKQRLIVEEEGVHEEIVMSTKQFNVLDKQWPITKKSLDQKHAGDLISGNARIAKLRSDLLQESRKDANAEGQLLPLSEAMKDINIKFGDLQKKVNRDKAAVKDTNTRLVKLTKDMDDQLALYTQQLRQKTDALNLRKTQELGAKKKAREMENEANIKAEEAMQAQKVQQEDVAEAKVEETEAEDKVDTSGSAQQSEEVNEQDALEQQLQALKVKTDAHIQRLETKAAAAVAKIKDQYSADLNELRVANGDTALTREDPQNSDLSKERQDVHELAKRLRAAIPPVPGSASEAALEAEKKAEQAGIDSLRDLK